MLKSIWFDILVNINTEICLFLEMFFVVFRAKFTPMGVSGKIHPHGVPCAFAYHFPLRGWGGLLPVWMYKNIQTVLGINICL